MRYTEIKKALLEAEILDEVSMSPSSLKKWLASPEADEMLIGFEFEMGVPGAATEDDSGDGEYDYDMDERAYDIDGIIQFFQNGDMADLNTNAARRISEEMWNQWTEWQGEQIADNIDERELNSRVRDRLEEDISVSDMYDTARERWKEANPDKDSESTEARDEIDVIKSELIDDELDDLIEEQGDEWQRARDEASEGMEEEMRDDGDYDQHAWLQDIGVDSMSDAENEWNLQWPHWNYYNSGGDVSVDDVADAFKDAMDLTQVNTSDSYHGARRDGKSWIIEPDGSIDTLDSSDGGLEFVSPPMPLRAGLEMVKKFKKWASSYGCYTNKSTGLHTNISVPGMTIDNLDYVKLALFMGDEHVLKTFGRQYNNYCKSATKIIKERTRPEDVSAVLAQMKQNLNSLASKTIHSGITDKFTSINTKTNYVEFRGPGGDYLDMDIEQLLNTAMRLAMSLRIATNPAAHKQEYAKKLYKLVEQDGDPDESVKLFSEYAMGQINKPDLISRLKFAHKARAVAKSRKSSVTRATNDPEIKREIDSLPFGIKRFINNIQQQDLSALDAYQRDLESGGLEKVHGALTAEQKSLITYLLENEKEVRAAEGEKKQYWVMNKDGTGGKQMVFAHTENEAVLTGGKQMGMSREVSITKLKAELMTSSPIDDMPGVGAMPASVPRSWKDWIEITLPTITVGTADHVKQRIESGADNLDADAKIWIIAAIDDEIHKRRAVDNNETRWKIKLNIPTTNPNYDPIFVDSDSPGQAKAKAVDIFRREQNLIVTIGDLDATAVAAGTYTSFADAQAAADRMNASGSDIDNVPQVWHAWINTLPNRSVETINDFRYQIEQGEQNNTLPNQTQRDALVRIIDAELRSRQDAGETTAMLDSLPEQWKDWLQHISTAGDANLQSNIDDLTNHPDRYREMSAEQRGYILDTINKEQRNRRESSPVPTTSREVFDGLPEVWQDWLQAIGQKAIDHLERAKSNVEYGNNNIVRNLDVHQKNYITATITQELMRRQANDANASTTDADNSVRESLPPGHQGWLVNISDHSDMGIINTLNNVSVFTELTDQQAAYFRVCIKRELRRRGINPDEATQSTTGTYADDADERERMRREREQISRDMSGQGELDFEQDRDAPAPEQDAGSDIDFEQDRDAAAQQGQLIDNDGPVVPQTTSTDFEVVKQDGSIVSTIRGGDMVYAHRKARELEQDLGLESGSLRVKALVTNGNAVALTRLRKLAGLA